MHLLCKEQILQTNVSGSNTSIEGGYTGGATTYESVAHQVQLQIVLVIVI